MTWWGWLLLATYIGGYVYAVPRIGYVIVAEAHGGDMSRADGVDTSFGVFFGLLLGSLWPIIYPGYLCHRRAANVAWLLRPPRHVRREAELAAREARVRRMERELGIGR